MAPLNSSVILNRAGKSKEWGGGGGCLPLQNTNNIPLCSFSDWGHLWVFDHGCYTQWFHQVAPQAAGKNVKLELRRSTEWRWASLPSQLRFRYTDTNTGGTVKKSTTEFTSSQNHSLSLAAMNCRDESEDRNNQLQSDQWCKEDKS